MYTVRVLTDQDECQAVWQRAIPEESVSDLWDFRACFHKHFRRPLCFAIAEDSDGHRGLLPLSWIEEAQCYGFFPGETWQGKTWLEQNRIPSRGDGVVAALLDHCPSSYHLRYLLPLDGAADHRQTVDEVGYLFFPGNYDYDLENYFQEFSRRSVKRLKRELASLEAQGVRYRCDDLSDFDRFVRLNVGTFGTASYFHDPRFRESFRELMYFLHERGWLRMTAILIGNDVAAVDMGCVYRGVYTLLGGGTDRRYPGVAKLINIHHIRRACEEQFDEVDFLCGDFSWKTMFHLTPRPLYLLSSLPAASHH